MEMSCGCVSKHISSSVLLPSSSSRSFHFELGTVRTSYDMISYELFRGLCKDILGAGILSRWAPMAYCAANHLRLLVHSYFDDKHSLGRHPFRSECWHTSGWALPLETFVSAEGASVRSSGIPGFGSGIQDGNSKPERIPQRQLPFLQSKRNFHRSTTELQLHCEIRCPFNCKLTGQERPYRKNLRHFGFERGSRLFCSKACLL